MSITQIQLAEHLGVTPLTISRALSNHPAVAAKTRRRVEDAARRLGYGGLTTWGAQAMAAKRYNRKLRSGILSVLVPSEQGLPYYDELLKGIERECLSHELSVLISPYDLGTLPTIVSQGRVDGVLIVVADVPVQARIFELDLPRVGVGIRLNEASGPCVLSDEKQGMYLATSHLTSLGHRRIAHITYRWMNMHALSRYEGYTAALADAGIDEHDALLCDAVVNTNERMLEEILDDLLQRAPDVTAIACYNDWIAMLTIDALTKRGIRVPEDLSVVGYDDISAASQFSPIVTSVRYDRCDMGRRAVRMLMKRIDGADAPLMDVLPVTLSEGQTVRPANRAGKL